MMSDNDAGFSIPLYRVSGADYYDVGLAIGRAAGERIRGAHDARREWTDKLLGFGAADPANRIDPFVSAMRENTPNLVDELRGIADGADVPFERLLAVLLNPELSAMMKSVTHDDGCTTVAVKSGDKMWIGHNEDGSASYLDFMYLVDVTWPSGVRALCFSYPGYLPGNGPSVNSFGMAQTVNYVGAESVGPGIPRYAIDRAIVEARDMDEAMGIATHKRRAYSQHHLIASASEKAMVSIETSPDKASVVPVRCLFAHANHYIHPEMRGVPQFSRYKHNSPPRQMQAEKWMAAHGDVASLAPDSLLEPLTSHDNIPAAICRHPGPETSGATLGTALIAVGEKKLSILHGPPCQGRNRDLAWPSAP